MPLCGTFHYAGVFPDLQVGLELGQWTFEDQSGAEKVPQVGSRLRNNRLVGLQPVAQISDSQLILHAAGRHRAEACSASVELDRTLLEILVRGGPPVNPGLDEWPRKVTWVDVSIDGKTSRLHDGEELADPERLSSHAGASFQRRRSREARERRDLACWQRCA